MVTRNFALVLFVDAVFAFVVWQRHPVVWTTMQIAGLALACFGFLMWSIARLQLGQSFAVTAQARVLVTHGIYSKIRNPIYVFGTVVIIGLILFWGDPRWLLILVLLIPLQIWRARKEAQVLEAKFGEDYRRYRASTWF